jgi:TonB family protein
MFTWLTVQRLIKSISPVRLTMLAQIQSGTRQQRLGAFCLSTGLHCLFLLWLLHKPGPRIVAPSFVVNGDHGTYIAHLYWPNRGDQAADHGSPGTLAADSRQQSNAHLTWDQHAKAAKTAKHALPRPKLGSDDETSMSGQSIQARAAGSPLGTVFDGPLTGVEVRPALPVVSPDPIVPATELNGLQGDVVIEVTIDDRGNIVQKIVIQSLAPAIDGKVLDALENWRFRPATRNGVAIPSKQDVYYHFPRLGKG